MSESAQTLTRVPFSRGGSHGCAIIKRNGDGLWQLAGIELALAGSGFIALPETDVRFGEIATWLLQPEHRSAIEETLNGVVSAEAL